MADLLQDLLPSKNLSEDQQARNRWSVATLVMGSLGPQSAEPVQAEAQKEGQGLTLISLSCGAFISKLE